MDNAYTTHTNRCYKSGVFSSTDCCSDSAYGSRKRLIKDATIKMQMTDECHSPKYDECSYLGRLSTD